jgi:hypothetical protein
MTMTRSTKALCTLAAAALIACAMIAPAAHAAGNLTVKMTGSGRVSGSGILCPPTCTSPFPRPSQYLIGFGQSEATSFGASSPSKAWPALLARDIHAIEDNLALIGAVAAYPNGSTYVGGWAWVLQKGTPGSNLAAPPASFTGTEYFGFNDMNDLGGPTRLGPFVQSMYTMISRMDSVAVFEDNGRTVSAPASGWASMGAKGDENSGTTLLHPTADDVPLTISVPASFQGGTIALGFTTGVVMNPPVGQVIYDVSVDGGAPRPYTIDGPSMVTAYIGKGGGAIGTVDRIWNLAKGAHTLKVWLVSAASTLTTYFDYWEALANQPAARPILLPLQFTIPPVGFTPFIGDPYVPDNTDIGTLNTVIQQIATQFGPNVQAVPVTLYDNPSNFYIDNDHPNDAGHALIAKQLLNALSTVTLKAAPKAGWSFRGWSGACSGTGTCTVNLSRNRTVVAKFS